MYKGHWIHSLRYFEFIELTLSYILSADKKIFYHVGFSSGCDDIIPEGVEIIADRAFENSYFDVLYLPHTLKKIEDYAFRNSSMALFQWKIIFLSKEVPTLGKEVFSFDQFFSGIPSLTIPKEWKDVYTTQDEQWTVFKEVTFEYSPPSTGAVKSQKEQFCSLHQTGSTLTCTSPNAIKLEVYTTEAMKVGETEFTNGTATVKVGKAPAAYLYIVTYPNGRRESGKVMVKE